jgi:hypothetical protein
MVSYGTHLYNVIGDARARLQNVVNRDTDEVLVHARMGLSRLPNVVDDDTFRSRRGRKRVRRAAFLARCCVSNELILGTLSERNYEELTFVTRVLRRASLVGWMKHRWTRRSSMKGMLVA